MEKILEIEKNTLEVGEICQSEKVGTMKQAPSHMVANKSVKSVVGKSREKKENWHHGMEV